MAVGDIKKAQVMMQILEWQIVKREQELFQEALVDIKEVHGEQTIEQCEVI